jgi:hypothetical protein
LSGSVVRQCFVAWRPAMACARFAPMLRCLVMMILCWMRLLVLAASPPSCRQGDDYGWGARGASHDGLRCGSDGHAIILAGIPAYLIVNCGRTYLAPSVPGPFSRFRCSRTGSHAARDFVFGLLPWRQTCSLVGEHV